MGNKPASCLKSSKMETTKHRHADDERAVGTGTMCPFSNADVDIDSIERATLQTCPFHQHAPLSAPSMVSPPKLARDGGTHVISQGSIDLLKDIGGGDTIRELCTRFYARAFLDFTLKPFFF